MSECGCVTLNVFAVEFAECVSCASVSLLTTRSVCPTMAPTTRGASTHFTCRMTTGAAGGGTFANVPLSVTNALARPPSALRSTIS
jgi:hypothetical protein